MSNTTPMPLSSHISFNADNCTGCVCCELACSAAHFGAFSSKLSAIRIRANYHLRLLEASVCRQCDSASCVNACKFDAIKFDGKTGARYIDDELCIKCGQCIKACPFSDTTEFPFIRKEFHLDEKVIIKCDLCHGIEGAPACIEICPRDALMIIDSKNK